MSERQLKFRAWDKAKEQWLDGGYGFHILGEANLHGGLFRSYRVCELNNIVITQFTGLTDKTGKDIYEGDILKHHKYGGEHEVKWVAESAGFFLGEESWALSAMCSPNIEVLGNIFAGNVYGKGAQAMTAAKETTSTKEMSDRDLDALVAERVMGWRHWRGRAGVYFLSPEERFAAYMQTQDFTEVESGNEENAPHYSTDIAAAFLVVEKMREHKCGLVMSVGAQGGKRWHVQFGATLIGGASYESLPRSICEAALAAVSATKSQEVFGGESERTS